MKEVNCNYSGMLKNKTEKDKRPKNHRNQLVPATEKEYLRTSQ